MHMTGRQGRLQLRGFGAAPELAGRRVNGCTSRPWMRDTDRLAAATE